MEERRATSVSAELDGCCVCRGGGIGEAKKGAATLSAAPHWITPGKNYLQGEATLGSAR
jgi:hypothetical protein